MKKDIKRMEMKHCIILIQETSLILKYSLDPPTIKDSGILSLIKCILEPEDLLLD
jgi:hypothetical protein